jgi:hypothetical protein
MRYRSALNASTPTSSFVNQPPIWTPVLVQRKGFRPYPALSSSQTVAAAREQVHTRLARTLKRMGRKDFCEYAWHAYGARFVRRPR